MGLELELAEGEGLRGLADGAGPEAGGSDWAEGAGGGEVDRWNGGAAGLGGDASSRNLEAPGNGRR